MKALLRTLSCYPELFVVAALVGVLILCLFTGES